MLQRFVKTAGFGLLCALLFAFAMLLGHAAYAGNAAPAESETMATLFDFTENPHTGAFYAVNDGVMGGISDGRFRLADGEGIFEGDVSLENNGGFASVRSVDIGADLGEADGIAWEVYGDGHTYRFTLRTNDEYRRYLYRQSVKTKAGEWQTIHLPFDQFVAGWRGRTFSDLPPPRAASVENVGVLIADKQEGPFELRIRRVTAYRDGD